MVSERHTDPKWANICKVIDQRDTHDRLMVCLTAGEVKLLNGKGKCRLDRCHVMARSIRPDLIYNTTNIYKVNHYSHINLDNCRSPLIGEPISRNERDYWWLRIINRSTERFDETRDYTTELTRIYS